jgi:hypothetical protein
MAYRFSLDPTSRKFICPKCGYKRFVRYVENDTGEYVHESVGRCDRENSCKYHYKPSQFFKDHTIDSWDTPLNFKNQNRTKRMDQPDKSKTEYISFDYITRSLKNYDDNRFVIFLKSLFTDEEVVRLIETFKIGTSVHWPGATIFWQIDKNGKCRTGKIMLYNSQNGRRISKPYPHVDWIHSQLIKKGVLKGFNLKQCFFGEHQLSDNHNKKPIALVESEKTAVIMTNIYPDAIWIATGGSHGAKWTNQDVSEVLKDENVIMYPDLDKYDEWKEKYELYKDQGINGQVSDLLINKATTEDIKKGYDIADYFIKYIHKSSIKNINKGFNKLCVKNPLLLKLVSTFDLVNEKTGLPFIIEN